MTKYGDRREDHPGRMVPRERFGVLDLTKAAASNLAGNLGGMAPEGPVTPFGMRTHMRSNEERWRYQSPEWNETMAQSPGVGGAYGRLTSTARRNAARNPK